MSFLESKVKGSIAVGRGDGVGILPVGPDGQVIIADSTQPLGVKYGNNASAVAMSMESLALTQYFSNLGLKPSVQIKSMTESLDTFDGVSGAGVFSYDGSRAKETAIASTYARYGLGAAYTKLLMIVGMFRMSTANMGIWIADTLAANVPQDGNIFLNEMNTNRTSLYKLPAFSNVTSDTDVSSTPQTWAPYPMMAIHADLSLATRRIRCYYRWNAEMWWPVLDVADNTKIAITQMQHAGVQFNSGPGFVGCPFGIWADL